MASRGSEEILQIRTSFAALGLPASGTINGPGRVQHPGTLGRAAHSTVKHETACWTLPLQARLGNIPQLKGDSFSCVCQSCRLHHSKPAHNGRTYLQRASSRLPVHPSVRQTTDTWLQPPAAFGAWDLLRDEQASQPLTETQTVTSGNCGGPRHRVGGRQRRLSGGRSNQTARTCRLCPVKRPLLMTEEWGSPFREQKKARMTNGKMCSEQGSWA